MNRTLFLSLSGLFLLLAFACDQETYEKPLPEKRFFYRFINLNPNQAPVDVRVRSIDDIQWLGYDITFEEAEPKQGYGSILIPVDTTERDTVEYVFLDVLDHRSKTEIVDPLEFGTIDEDNAEFPATFMLIDSFGKTFRVKTVDNFETPPGGTAGIRFVNMNNLLVSVSLLVKNDTTAIERYNFLTYSPFEYVGFGKRTIYFKNDLTGTIVDSIPDIQLDAGGVYSFYLAQKEGKSVVGYEILR